VNLSLLKDDGARQLIRQRIQAGQLPRDHTIELWQGPGFGQPCDGCGLAIMSANQMSLVCAEDWRLIRLHAACFALWDEERRAAPTMRTG